MYKIILKNSLLVLIFLNLFSLNSCMSTSSIYKKMTEVSDVSLNFRENFTNNDANRFSLVIIPDSQCYSHYSAQNYKNPYSHIFWRQTNFIANNSVKNGGDFSFAIHVGDFSHEKPLKQIEWNLSYWAMTNLVDQIPMLTVPGNHDYDIMDKSGISGSSVYNHYYGPESVFYKNKDWFGGSSMEGRNSWSTFNAANKDFLVIGLEICPSDESLKWAENVIEQHKNWPTILVTHEYIEATAISKKEPFGNAKFIKSHSRNSYPQNQPEQLWTNFISSHNQIFLVICGHSSYKKTGSGLRIDKNLYNNTTYTILSDYQMDRNYLKFKGEHSLINQSCGDGWLTILDFDLTLSKLYVHTYSTEFDTFRTDNYADLELPIDWDWNQRFKQEEK